MTYRCLSHERYINNICMNNTPDNMTDQRMSSRNIKPVTFSFVISLNRDEISGKKLYSFLSQPEVLTPYD